MSNALFITAAQRKYRYDSPKGQLTTEQLFDLQLKATRAGQLDLDEVAKETNRQLKQETEESFVSTRSNPLKNELENKLEIIKAVIAMKQEEAEKVRLAGQRAGERQRILEAIDQAKTRQLSQASVEDLEKQLAALS